MQRLVGFIAAKRGMADSLRILLSTNSELFADTSGMVPLALRRLTEAAVADGSIRGDIDSSDILQALSRIYAAPDTPDWQARAPRRRSLPLAGLPSCGHPA